MKINTLLLASTVAAAPAPLEKRQAGVTFAGSCATTVNPLNLAQIVGTSCSYAVSSAAYTQINCVAPAIGVVGVALCSSTVASQCTTTSTVSISTVTFLGFPIPTTTSTTTLVTNSVVSCSTRTFAPRPSSAIASTTAAGGGLVPLPVPTVLPTILPTIAVPTVPSLSLPSVALPSVSIPSVALPSLSVPSIALPSVSLPSVALPSLSLPSIALPSVSIPSVALPSLSVPSIALPSLSAPSIALPSVTLPSIALPSVSLPSVALPSLSLPSIALPSVSIPSVALPSLSIPSVALPSLSVPSIALPSLSAPSIALPSVTLPSIALPSVSIPSVALPSLSIPSVALPSLSAPSIALPSVTLPSVALPSPSLPSVALPSVSIPATLPSIALPSLSLPSIALPSVSVPSVALPSLSVPSIALPSVTLPSIALPSVSLPVTLPSVPAPSATILPTAGVPRVTKNGAIYNGCYADSVNNRALPVRLADVGTVDQCVSACQAAGFSVAGLEYMHECYCGTTVPSDKIADSACNAPCDGDATQTCGNGNALQVYNILSLPALSSTGIVLPTASPSAAVKSIPLVVANDANAPATFSGCYQDSVNARSLPVQVANVGSVEQCVAACAAQGFALAGVEYTNECFCGNAITAPQIAVTSCQKYTCNAAPSEYCGGDNALQVYRLSGAAAPSSAAVPTSAPTTGVKAIPLVVANGANAPATFSGCYQDSVNARSLPVQVANVGSVEQCVAACAAQGFALAGVEYTNECFCGNAITAPQVAVSRCQQYTCSAAATEYCGGDDSLQVYRLSGAPTTAAPPAATSSAAVNVATIPLVTASGATFRACYLDNTGARALRTRLADVTDAQPANTCATACKAAGFTLSGLEYGHECWCDNSINNGQTITSNNDCSQICDGNSQQYCGNADRVQVYNL